MDALTDEQVSRLLPLLASRARASGAVAEAFRPPQTGIIEQVASNWHYFVVGRRGVGKSMLLLNVRQHAENRGQPVAYIDIETLRDTPYPDVLIRLLLELAKALDETLKSAKGSWWRRRRVRRDLAQFAYKMTNLLRDPQEAQHERSSRSFRVKRAGGGAKLELGASTTTASAGVGAHGEVSGESEAVDGWASSFSRTKMEGLQAEATEFRGTLASAVEALGGKTVLFILDDFYFIPRENQPDVLSYLHQVVKNLDIWLKVGAVEHRLNEFEDGNPPRGLQLNQDAAKARMDVTLAEFGHTQAFLEGILTDICREAEVQFSELVTDTARTRLVIASGGVPRDYLNFVRESLANSSLRDGSNGARPKNRVTAEDVTTIAPGFLKQKQDDLGIDARPEDVERLHCRLNDVLRFCLDTRKTNVFLVETRALRELQWGQDIDALSDLRFFHRLGNTTVKSSTPQFVGSRYDAFALDLSSYAASRVTEKELKFWTTDGQQKLRAVRNVYTPEAAAKATNAPPVEADRAGTARRQMKGQLTLDDAIGGDPAE